MVVLMRYVTLISVFVLWTNGMDNEKFVDREWWENTLIYQIWPRGFQDSDGDGEGDLKGIISRLDYLTDLGIETICLSPIYHSPLFDSGFDVSNYTDVNPVFGDLGDFDNLMQKAHDRGLRVILDIIPNHSSDQHEWFKLSAKNVVPYTDYYIWTDSNIDENGKNIPPNDWISTYNDEKGSAWTWHDERQQWYYHKFHSFQPDLNLRNEKVIKELKDIFDFWLKRNVDGFRINAVPVFFEDKDLKNESLVGKDIYTFGLPESTALLYTFREHIDTWVSKNKAMSKLLIAESYDSDDNLLAYYGNSTHKGIAPLNFKFITHIDNNDNASYIKHILEKWLERLPQNTKTNWVLSNHDHSRATSRIGLNRIDGLHMLSLFLPGQAYTYYGEEIAMLDTEISWERTIDPNGCARGINEYIYFSRDPVRTPMQWKFDISAGFSTNMDTYLPVNPNYIFKNVVNQQNKNESNLKVYMALAILRKDSVFTDGGYELKSLNNDRVLVLKRFLKNYPVYIIVINLSLRLDRVNLTSIYPNLQDTLDTVVASSNAIGVTDTVQRDNFVLSANAALVLKSEEQQGQTTTEPTSTTSKVTSSTENSTTESTTKKEEESSTRSKPDGAMLNSTPAFMLIISSIVISCKF